MIKKIILTVLVLLAALPVFLQASDFTDLDITIGNVRVPKAFIHAGKEYNKGHYWVTLKAKNGIPYFNVCDQKKELLFEELAVLVPVNTAAPAKKIWNRVTKQLLVGYEYFRIKVTRPDSEISAFLLMKPTPATPSPAATPAPVMKKTEEVEMH